MNNLLLLCTISFLFAPAISKADDSLKNVEIETAYQDSAGRTILRFKFKDPIVDGDGNTNPKSFGTDLTFYGTDTSLFQQKEDGYAGSFGTDGYEVDLHDPRITGDDKSAFFAGVDQQDSMKSSPNHTMVCGKQTDDYKPMSPAKIASLQSAIRAGKVPLTGLPDERETEYLFKTSDGKIIYVDDSKYSSSYDNFRMFVGKPGDMKEMKIKDVARFRDGGTTNITAANGQILYSPTAFDQSKKPSWSGTPISKVDASTFDLSTLKIPGIPATQANLHTPCDKFFPAASKPAGNTPAGGSGTSQGTPAEGLY